MDSYFIFLRQLWELYFILTHNSFLQVFLTFVDFHVLPTFSNRGELLGKKMSFVENVGDM